MARTEAREFGRLEHSECQKDLSFKPQIIQTLRVHSPLAWQHPILQRRAEINGGEGNPRHNREEHRTNRLRENSCKIMHRI